MTLNRVINRVKALSLAHKQIRAFERGLVTDFFADKTSKYPAALLQDNGGTISTAGHATTISFRLFLVDLVHVNSDTNDNELDVQSDMLSVAMDLVAEFNSGIFDDWALSTDNVIQLIYEGDNDLHAGCYFDFSIRIMFAQNTCQIPTEIIDGSPTDTDMKTLYDVEYIATGAEGQTLTIPIIKGKKIMLVTRESGIIYKVSNNPDSAEYTWNNTDIGLGIPVIENQRFLILYRNY